MENWVVAFTLLLAAVLAGEVGGGEASDSTVPSTLDGPFGPVTMRLDDEGIRGDAIDLSENDPRVVRWVRGFKSEQISISLSATVDYVRISWVTGDFQMGDAIQPLDPTSVASIVRYGRLRHRLALKAMGRSLVYEQIYPFKGMRNYTSGIIHHVRLTGLELDNRYFFRCGDPFIPAMSTTHEFRIMPVSVLRAIQKRISVVGDLGLTYNTTSTIDHMKRNKPDLILLAGDVTYANLYLTNGTGSKCYSSSFPNTPIHETYQPRWDL